jgi:Peptidase M50B-like
VATLVAIRNAFGALAVVATGAVIGYVAGWAPVRVQDGFAAALSWFLVFGALRATAELRRSRSRHSDADMLARLTHVPGGMWAGLFWLLAGVAVITTAWILLLRGTT